MIPNWREILAPVVQLTEHEAEAMDIVARTHPQMAELMARRMRAAADRLLGDKQFMSNFYGGPQRESQGG